MLTLTTPAQIQRIVNSVKRVFEKNDIQQLTKQAYEFLYLSSGFIAHYNLYGFQSTYENVDLLARDILDNKCMNQWSNFHEGEEDYEYMMQKKDIYNQLVKLADKHLNPLFV